MSLVQPFVTALLAFFAIMNPLSGTPVFLSLTQGESESTRKTIALRAVLLAFGIITVFAVFGKVLFEAFGITLPALRIAGGIVVFLVGFHMLQSQTSSVQHPSAGDTEAARTQELSVAISPLGMPLLAGPGSIATAMNLSAQGGISGVIATVVAFAVMCLVTYLFFRFGGDLMRRLGTNALNVISRLMGLILAVIGVQMLVMGLGQALPGLAH